MKTINNLLLVTILISCGYKTDTNAGNKPTIKRIELKKVDFGITSIITVECDKFEEYFKNEIVTMTIENPVFLENIQNILYNLKRDTTKYKPDVRAKLSIYYENSMIDTLCMSDIGILVNGQSYIGNKEFVELIEGI